MAAKKSTPPAGATPKDATPKAPKAKKTRWYRQLWAVFQMTRRHDPPAQWWMLGSFLAIVAVTVLVAAFTGLWFFTLFVGLPTALLVPLIILGRRAERAAYAQIDGQPGASVAALQTIRRGWTVEKEPVAVDPRTQDLVFRAVGKAGVVLVSEGPAARVGKLLESEKRRVARVLPNVPIHLIQYGNEEGQVPINRLVRTVQKLKGKLTAAETAEIAKRLKALGAIRLPVPKGIDPMRARPDRRGMRGR